MKKSQLIQIIKEEISKVTNDDIINQLKAEAKDKDERIEEAKIIAGRSQVYLKAFVGNNLDNFHKENALELSKKIDKFLKQID